LAQDEAGPKIGVPTALHAGVALGMRTFPGDRHDGHSVRPALDRVDFLSDQRCDTFCVKQGL